MNRTVLVTVAAAVLGVLAGLAAGAGPVGWRTDWTGRYPDADPPTEWSPTKNVVWKTAMPSWSNATPVIVGEKLFVCSEPAGLICVNLADGKVLWTRNNSYEDMLMPEQIAQHKAEAAKAAPLIADLKAKQNRLRTLNQQARKDPALKGQLDALAAEVKALQEKVEPLNRYNQPATHKVNGYSSPTPVSDGRLVYVTNCLGIAACYDLDGNRKWITFVERPTHKYGHCSSPVLVDGRLFVQVIHGFMLDAATGKQLWRTEAKGDGVWGTAVHVKVGGADVLVTPAGDAVSAADGKVLARGLAKLEYASPFVDAGVVYFVEGGGKALRLPDQAAEGLKCRTLWTAEIDKNRYYSSAVLHGGLIYAITRACQFTLLEAAGGNVVYTRKLDLGKGEPYPSIAQAGKFIYVTNDNGTTVVLEAGKEYKEVVRNSLDTVRSTPVFAGKRMYIRTYGSLYCIGQ